MPIERSGSVGGGESPPNGIQARFSVKKAELEKEARYGPQYALDLDMVDDAYFGTSAKFWTRLHQPRLDTVRRRRSEKVSDKIIAEMLKDQGFSFKKLDEPEAMKVNRGGNTYKLLVAVCGGDYQAAETVLDSLSSFQELGQFFVDKTFVGTTKIKEKETDGQKRSFVNVNGEEGLYPDVGPIGSAAPAANEADYEDLDYDAPPPDDSDAPSEAA